MKQNAIKLIRDFFGASVQEIRALTSADRAQLASGIAQFNGFAADECEFEKVAY